MKKFGNNKNFAFLLLFALCLINFSCKESKHDRMLIPLEYFTIKDMELDSITRLLANTFNCNDEERVAVMDFMLEDSCKVYRLSCHDKSYVMESYIYWQNRRIIGYTEFDTKPVILLSSVQNHRDFLNVFSSELELHTGEKTFDFIYVPNCRYKWIEDTDSWRDKGILYEPIFFVYRRNPLGGFEAQATNNPGEVNFLNHEADILKALGGGL